jgi:hypothetical protein
MAARFGRRANKYLQQHYSAKQQTAAAAIRILTSQEAQPKDSAEAVTLATNLASRVADTPIFIKRKVGGNAVGFTKMTLGHEAGLQKPRGVRKAVGFTKMKLTANSNKKGAHKAVAAKNVYKKSALH